MGKVFTKGLHDKDEQKEGLFKRLKNTQDKSKELPNALSKDIKASKNVNNGSDFYYNFMYNFRRFYKHLASLDSERSELIDFYKLFRDFKDFEPLSDDTKKLKNNVMNKTHQLYNKYFNTYKEEYDIKDLNEEDKIFF